MIQQPSTMIRYTKNMGAPSHHVPCLSGSSQAPLIPSATNGDNGSERSTPVSAHSLPFGSPNKAPHKSGTPKGLNSASVTTENIFTFPPQVRSMQQLMPSKPQTSLDMSCKSPRSADVNMNAEHERNREPSSSHHATISPGHSRFSPSSKLNSPLNMSTKSFFPQPHSFTHQQQQTSRSSNTSTSNNIANWPQQQEDLYHLYHEPIDPDESSLSHIDPRQFQSNSMQAASTPNLVDHIKLGPAPTPARSINSTLGANQSSRARDWLFAVPGTPTNKSPSIIANNNINPTSSNSNSQPMSSFAERAEPKRLDDVQAANQIYSCYVSLKSTERDNVRSRSYHGPKNTSSHNQSQQSPYFKDAAKNLSSTSVAELPVTPSAFASNMIPIHFRNHCVRELIETESNYVHALEMIIRCFAKPLETFLRRDDHQLIFGHIKYFHHIHSTFQADLVKAAFGYSSKDIINLSSPNRASSQLTAAQCASQTSSNPSTPTTINNIPQFLSASPLASPNAQDLPSTPNKSATNGTSLKISSCFLNAKDKFLKYGEYCATISKAQALLDELTSKNEAIAAQLDRCQHDANEGKFKLRDLLSLPMQRILKYHLLLAQLIKNTSTTNEDYHGLKRAHETMVDLGLYINEVKRDTEDIQIINDIEQCITSLNMPDNTQLIDYGRLVTDGLIRTKLPKAETTHDTKLKLSHHDTKMKQKRYVFVFDKVMLMCKVIGDRRFQYKEALALSEYEIDTSCSISQAEAVSKHLTKDKWSYTFNLVRSSDNTTYSFYTKTLDMRNKWIDRIQKAMDNIRPAACRNNETNHDFLMHTFDKTSSCDHCGKLLLGLYYQGYRCRTCFASSHKKCIAAIRPCGPTLPFKPSNTLSHCHGRGKEPPSPSVRSNCSDDSHESGNSYVNFILNEYRWYCGRMERDKAQSYLENKPHGTFLVRVSPKHNGSYVISLNYNGQVKHMRIYVSKDNQLYLSQNRYFKSVTDLVSWYEKNSLVESFHMLDARLAIPFKSN